ncbi:hypothetical protein EJ08DRAFT_731382 [Tothia fuscella]|uniref:BTB domain-containing protein n=1 Tax=Tothia fuscella TaxID=1048955 RepID=A0A9P4NZ64_9PEZI|nr:hypothetical protein EJ08DRAFT_731382 [Tothia fuscella]
MVPRNLESLELYDATAPLYTDIVTLHVGVNKIKFCVDKYYITSTSQFFKAAFAEGRWRESEKDCIYLQDDHPWTVKTYIDWIYHGRKLVTPTISPELVAIFRECPDSDAAELQVAALVEAYLFADKIIVIEFQTAISRALNTLAITKVPTNIAYKYSYCSTALTAESLAQKVTVAYVLTQMGIYPKIFTINHIGTLLEQQCVMGDLHRDVKFGKILADIFNGPAKLTKDPFNTAVAFMRQGFRPVTYSNVTEAIQALTTPANTQDFSAVQMHVYVDTVK